MLDIVLARLRALGLLPLESQAYCNVFVRLDNVLVDVFDEYGRHYYLRMADAYDLEPEYRIAMAVGQAVGRFVPQVLAFIREGDLSCIVLEGVEFTVLSGTAVRTTKPSDALGRELLAYFGHASRSLAMADQRVALNTLVESVENRYRGTPQEPLWNRVLSATNLQQLAALPSQRQHGDFVPNNFGMRPQGLVIFDWEDFGRVDLPGFDLAVLLGSLVDFDPTELRGLRDAALTGHGALQVPWLRDACRIAGVEQRSLLRALPFHLLLFMWLKDRYSKAIRDRVSLAVESLL